jgi:hypothetical protein
MLYTIVARKKSERIASSVYFRCDCVAYERNSPESQIQSIKTLIQAVWVYNLDSRWTGETKADGTDM